MGGAALYGGVVVCTAVVTAGGVLGSAELAAGGALTGGLADGAVFFGGAAVGSIMFTTEAGAAFTGRGRLLPLLLLCCCGSVSVTTGKGRPLAARSALTALRLP